MLTQFDTGFELRRADALFPVCVFSVVGIVFKSDLNTFPAPHKACQGVQVMGRNDHCREAAASLRLTGSVGRVAVLAVGLRCSSARRP